MSNATEPVTFVDLLHTARAYIRAVHVPEDAPPRYKQLTAWRALPTLEGAGYDHDRIWQHLRNLERLAMLERIRTDQHNPDGITSSIGVLELMLKWACPHNPETHSLQEDDGFPFRAWRATCHECGASWYEFPRD